MKLLEVISYKNTENKIDEEIVVTPSGTGRDRVFNIVDTDSGQVLGSNRIRGSAQAEADRLIATRGTTGSTPSNDPAQPRVQRERTSRAASIASERTLLFHSNDGTQTRALRFENPAAAQEALSRYNGSDPDFDVDAWERDTTQRYGSSVRPYNGRNRVLNYANRVGIERDIDRDRLLNSSNWQRVMTGFWFRTLERAGIAVITILSVMAIIDEIRADVESGELSEAEGQEAINMACSAGLATFILDLMVVFASARVISVLRKIRIAWRAAAAVQVAASPATLGGTLVTGALTFVLGEIGFWALRALIQSTGVQRAIAEAMANSVFAEIFNFAGSVIFGTAQGLRTIVGGLMGGGPAISDAFFQESPAEAPTGLASAATQWARETFAFTLFGKRAKRLVPYTTVGARQAQVFEVLGIDPNTTPEETTTAPTTPQQTNPGRGDGRAEVERRRQDNNGQPVATIGGQELSQAELDAAREVAGSAVDAVPAQPTAPRGNPSGASSWEDMTPEDFRAMAASGNFGG